MATYVGGTHECIASIPTHSHLESFLIGVNDSVTWDTGTINPPPQVIDGALTTGRRSV
ncbi:hypothetical protein [Rhodococcus koreensis]|uniref:hypothetical protein n=1 Tax=Rhodococcus koreensis TaxID=99653 RepID=UPI000AC76270|nr:hypothetical protein [Rhodococcus koreensis]